MAWRLAVVLLASTAAAAPAFAQPPAQAPAAPVAVLDIPYVPQSEALCGGAAAAMVLRYWGARDVVAEDFAPLLDEDKTGIRVDRLAEGVRARGWQAVALTGTDAIARDQLSRRRPVIALVSVGRGRFHYVVLAAWTDRGIIAHDPARAPDRVYRPDEFENAWARARHWMLVISPPADAAERTENPEDSEKTPASASRDASAVSAAGSTCDAIVANAVNQARSGATTTERLLTEAIAECPSSAAPLREMAGYRLMHGAPADAVSLATRAVKLDPGDAHAWYLLGAAEYLRHDAIAALEAWNHIGEPRLDLVQVEGLDQSSYESVARAIGTGHGEVITAAQLARGRRRVTDLPAIAASRVDIEPKGRGIAEIDVGIVERSTVPRSRAELVIAGARAVVDRELAETFSNVNGSGDAWSASWRWWADRPRVAFGFAAPGLLGTRAVWRVDGSWDAESYASSAGIAREERTHAAISAADWLTPHVKWQASSGLDRWSDRGPSWFGGVALTHASSDDRLEAGIDATMWAGRTTFSRGGAHVSWLSRSEVRGWRVLGFGGAAIASASAPRDVWPGAGAGHARTALLRAHPLLDGGVITGPAFGRGLEHATVALEKWPATVRLWSVGVAAFVDAAAVQHRFDESGGARWFADAGAGVRLHAAWLPGILRVDFAHGLRDGANAVSVGWQSK